MAWLVPFLVYWFVLFVVSYILVEYGHRYLYDEVPKLAPVRVAVGSMLLAALLTWTHTSFATMFTSDIKWTALQAIAWVGVFVLIYAFQPLHGLAMAIASMVLVTGMATIAVDTMTQSQPDERTQFSKPPPPMRKSASGPSAIIKTPVEAEPAKTK